MFYFYGEVSMEIYKNLGGDSGIEAYEFGDDFIKVQFSEGTIYTYTYNSAGRSNIEHMKTLAMSGNGLNSFINKHVRKKYASKSRSWI